MKSIRIISVLFLLMYVTGCASTVCVLSRCNTIDAKVPPYYPATACDAAVAYSCLFKNSPSGPSFDIWSGKFIWLPFALVDMPVSLVTDTVFLPYDVYRAYRPREEQWDDSALERRRAIRDTKIQEQEKSNKPSEATR